MKKSLLALAALSAFATAAQAQSSVTIYGIVDVSYGQNKVEAGNTSASSVKTTGVADSANASSRIGFRGTEDLGGGLKGGFVLESGLNITGGTSFNKGNGTGASATPATNVQADSAVFGAATRQAFVTLGTDKSGTLLAGYKKQLESDFNDSFMFATENSYGAEAQELNRIGRANQFNYTLPTFVPGLTAVAGYTAHKAQYELGSKEASDKVDVSIVSANLIYKNANATLGAHFGSGSVDLGTAITEAQIGSAGSAGTAAFAVGNNDYDTQALGAAYDFGFLKAAVQRGKRDTGKAGTRLESTYTTAGIAVPMGKTTLKASISKSKSEDASGNTVSDNSGYQLQADYSLSKRTTAWALYGVDKKEAVAAASAVSGVSAAISSAAAIDYSALRVGITHSF